MLGPDCPDRHCTGAAHRWPGSCSPARGLAKAVSVPTEDLTLKVLNRLFCFLRPS